MHANAICQHQILTHLIIVVLKSCRRVCGAIFEPKQRGLGPEDKE